MKWDFAIGNPPYNQEAQLSSTSDDPVYHYIMDNAYEISDKVIVITPARFLMNAGKTPTAWNKKMLKDPHFKVLYYEENSTNVFPSALIPGGVAVTYRDALKEFGAIEEFIVFPELASIDKKVKAHREASLNTIMYSQNKFDLVSLYKDYPEMKEQIGSEGKDKRFRQIVLERFPDLFTEEPNDDSLRILGLVKRQRAYRYIDRKYVEKDSWIDSYKVFVPFSNGASGTLGEQAARMISKPVLGYPSEGITQTFIGVGSFKTEMEARNLLKYIHTKFARVLLGILKVTQGNKAETWAHVPLQDFSIDSDIDWSVSVKEIDQQLYKKYGLSQREVDFVEAHIKELE